MNLILLKKTDTILAICAAQKAGTIRCYTYNGLANLPDDYPKAFRDIGVGFSPCIRISKASSTVSMISIEDVVGASGVPKTIFGYCNATRLFWGAVL